MAAYERGRKPQFLSNASHLVFEKFPKRFDYLKIHFFRKSPDVMVGLYHGRGSLDAHALDHVRIEGSLGKETDA